MQPNPTPDRAAWADRARFDVRSALPLGLSATYRPGERAVRRGLDEGVTYLFEFGFDTQMTRVIRAMTPSEREQVVVATGCSRMPWRRSLTASLERALRRLHTDYIDVFHLFGVMKPRDLSRRVRDELAGLRSDPRVRAVAVSCHDRKFAGTLAADGAVDVLMVRYNAAHPGAEHDIFPFVDAARTGIVAYTATRWTYLLRRPRGWPADQKVASPGQCYRFVLSDPAVSIVLCAPRSERELVEDVSEVRRGPLDADELQFMRRFGEHVHARAGWFMGG